MRRHLPLTLVALLAIAAVAVAFDGGTPARAQMGQMGSPAQCSKFSALNIATQTKANAVQTAMKTKADRKEICRLMTVFVGSEGSVVKFLIDNKTWCGISDQIVAAAKASHEKSVKFRDVVCTEAAGPESADAQRRHQDHAGRFVDQYQDRPRRHLRHAHRQSVGTMIRR